MAFKLKGFTPFTKQKGGGTTKTCLPAAKIRSMSKSQRDWRRVDDPSKKCGE